MANPETTQSGITTPTSVEDTSERPTGTTSTPETSPATMKSSFVERMSGIPVIDAAVKYGTSAYKQVKEYNKISSFALTKAEETAVFLACTAVPYVKKIEPQVKVVDDFACRGLDLVEEKLPILTRPPEEILEETRKLCASTVQTGYQKVGEMKTYGTEAVNRVKNYGMQKATEALEDCLNGTETLVEKYLPPAGNEESKETTLDNLSVAERASYLKNKVGSRVYGHGLVQVHRLHSHSQDAIEKLSYTIDLVKYIKDNYSPEKLLKNYVDDAKIKATWIWEEISKEEPLESAEAEKSVERRLISLARRLTTQIVHTYALATSSVKEVPQTYSENLTVARNFAAELFIQLDKAIEKNEVTSSVLQMVREKVDTLQKLAKSVVSSAPPPQEMVEMSTLSKDENAGASASS